MSAFVAALACAAEHCFSKRPADEITLLAGLGVEGDAHAGVTVQHRSHQARNPGAPNLRQVHLIAAEWLEELQGRGFALAPGVIGENVTTRGLDLPNLPRGTRLRLGAEAMVELTGLRNPCRQLDAFQSGLTSAMVARDGAGRLLLKAGVMGIVCAGGRVRQHDAITVELPPQPHVRLERV